jgi:hypothetical protein
MRDASSGVKLKIALFGELSLEEAMDLSRDRQVLELGRWEVAAIFWYVPFGLRAAVYHGQVGLYN